MAKESEIRWKETHVKTRNSMELTEWRKKKDKLATKKKRTNEWLKEEHRHSVSKEREKEIKHFE